MGCRVTPVKNLFFCLNFFNKLYYKCKNENLKCKMTNKNLEVIQGVDLQISLEKNENFSNQNRELPILKVVQCNGVIGFQ